MTKAKKEYKCFRCEEPIKFGKDKARLNLNGSPHICGSIPVVSKIDIPDKVEEDIEWDDDPSYDQHDQGNDIKEFEKEFKRADKLPIRPPLRVKKIIVSRTMSINYGVAKESGLEKEDVISSFTLGMEADTDADLLNVEQVTRDLLKSVEYILTDEFKKKTVLRLLK